MASLFMTSVVVVDDNKYRFHTLPEPGKGTILALRTWNTLLLLAVLGRNYDNRAKQTNKISRKIFK